MNYFGIESVLQHYIVAALWSSHDNADENGGEPLDVNYGPDDLAPSALAAMRRDVVGFVNGCEEFRPGVFDGMDLEQIGHDFWLTRNGHGAGFWDRGLGEIGEWLTSMAKPYGDADLYVGDDGLIYQSGDES